MSSHENSKVSDGSELSFTKIWHNKPYDAICPSRPELSAQGKNVIITGGGTGIGKAIAKAFGQANAASVSIVGRREDRLVAASKEIAEVATGATRVLYRVTDLTDGSSTGTSFESIADEVGNFHILVSNAGVLGELGPIANVNVDDLMKAFEGNVRTALNALQAFVPHASDSPVIINISTATLCIPPIPGALAYTGSKWACLKAFEYFAAENPGFHIVQIQPGIVSTEMNKNMREMDQDRPELPGAFCVWLASTEARFLKNKFVWSNWDVGELKERADEIQKSNLLTFVLEGFPQRKG